MANYVPELVEQLYTRSLRLTLCWDSANHTPLEDELQGLAYYLGGNSPWIPKKRNVSRQAIEPPEGCQVEQVHMISRHAERYPTINAGTRHLSLLQRLAESRNALSPVFDFLANWTYFTSVDRPAFEQLTSTSQNAGTLEAFNTGVKLRTRYPHLIPANGSTRIWSASSPRDVATARYFADGFFGREWEKNAVAELEVVPETMDRGADTLTPGDTCLNYVEDTVEGHDKGYGVLAHWQKVYIRRIIEHLQTANSNMTFTPVDVYSMMEMCGFEMLARDGISPWCGLFDQEAWLDFEYARDLLHFYRAGPGNRFSKVMGMLWLNATLSLLEQGSSAGTLFFSFVHDGDIIPILSALGYPAGYDNEPCETKMPSDTLVLDRAYRTSDITPMGGRIILERLQCESAGSQEIYVRLNINDGIVPIGHDTSGPGHSTTLQDFKDYLMVRAKMAGDFREVCGLEMSAPSKITFLHQGKG
ncbi:putative multiple inositol polyphosphate phosphatase [Phaeomoniella chlamydospora]|uniref:Putative multiple inositol polyphosphate phosphatase n=1 Tax=Phaeomoniella chlamydospora TaxID=158046 RepID=A0A0G2DTL0_PHACM|nr:putative multiple inositol polyphosphate phosphatase [Phaeomoniella chlamydospora]